ncbi:tRNA (N6-threonylcarbamoyladenosine(37)-N6)-methyltransferase TrmO [Chitinibacter bivalviorum]|uniref:tRNA (N6-threonylcarbamoyladenosine(37)-N6)-methyltransferase TrmO n=1 Tax=Chitinibacter bivalviorum TaxID=2739434 RepID=A0A7H9BKA2_9NEIS|nr:tRNA (N6-threonylcarbamoyladenosine(37)-N6)-methyltransferase TrmO [Chitinibacter bivalviorum]QLG88451.1 tRNA (N6-threonylcarbamoyladenosine(37)-N6)-methyltransferase TrmO [Chitinibacter bivalviorum]
MTTNPYSIEPIGYIATPFADKFGIPRQPQLAPHAIGTLKLVAPYNRAECVRGLSEFSHVWLQFVFHEVAGQWSPTVRPPRLGGNAKVGVFASRSPFRPNSLGLSLVRLLKVEVNHGVELTLGGVDLVDGTPIIDIKPYLPFVESQPEAKSGFVAGAPAQLQVQFSPLALAQIAQSELPNLQPLITEVLAQDPRPAYADDAQRIYGIRLYHYDVKWRCDGQIAWVEALETLANDTFHKE